MSFAIYIVVPDFIAKKMKIFLEAPRNIYIDFSSIIDSYNIRSKK